MSTPGAKRVKGTGCGSAKKTSKPSTSGLSPEVTRMFTCKVCANIVVPPIFQCPGEHLVCSLCQPMVKACPNCSLPFGDDPALNVEILAKQFSFPCKYTSKGCRMELALSAKADHETMCEYGPCPCLFTSLGCKWAGAVEDAWEHIRNSHGQKSQESGRKTKFIVDTVNNPDCNEWIKIWSYSRVKFALVLAKRRMGNSVVLCALVQLIGLQKKADKFWYRLEMKGNDRWLTWKAKPRGIRESVDLAIMKRNCLVVDPQQFAVRGRFTVGVTMSDAVPARRSPASAPKPPKKKLCLAVEDTGYSKDFDQFESYGNDSSDCSDHSDY